MTLAMQAAPCRVALVTSVRQLVRQNPARRIICADRWAEGQGLRTVHSHCETPRLRRDGAAGGELRVANWRNSASSLGTTSRFVHTRPRTPHGQQRNTIVTFF